MLIAAIVFVVVMVIGLPIAFALGLMGTVHMLSLGNESYLLVIIQRLFDQVDLISLTCLPFFIMAGEIMNSGGVSTPSLFHISPAPRRTPISYAGLFFKKKKKHTELK